MTVGTICIDPSDSDGRELLQEMIEAGWVVEVDAVHNDGNINFLISKEPRLLKEPEDELIEELKRISEHNKDYEYTRTV